MEWLSTRTLRHGELTQVAACVGVSPRTLRAWRARAQPARRAGRPARASADHAHARRLVGSVLEALTAGHDGWRSVQAALERDGETLATRLIQAIVRDLKAERAQRVARRLAANRVHVEVLARDAIWGSDWTHVGRHAGRAIEAVIVRETHAPRTLSIALGWTPTGDDLAEQLALTAQTRGGWPLVLMLDNGGANRAEHVQQLLRNERVLVLWNEPRTPQHNSRTERGIEDLKLGAGLTGGRNAGAGPVEGPISSREPGSSCTRSDLLVRLIDAWVRLDRCQPRETLGGLTPEELDRIAPRADACVRRDLFYAEVCSELERVRAQHMGARARRRAEREVVWCALERAGLVTRTRGGGAVQAFKAEGVS